MDKESKTDLDLPEMSSVSEHLIEDEASVRRRNIERRKRLDRLGEMVRSADLDRADYTGE